MTRKNRMTWLVAGVVALIAATASAWMFLRPEGLPPGIAKSNGRIEAVEIEADTLTPGRISSILVDEGDIVHPGQVLARMDTSVLDAQFREAQAHLQSAVVGIQTAQSQIAQREADRKASEELLRQRQVDSALALKSFRRMQRLARSDAISEQQLDDARARYEGARAAVAAAQAQVSATVAALGTAHSQAMSARAQAEAARATVERIQADIDNSVLHAPRFGRVQYRIAQPGEVLAAGAPVLSMIDLTDVYMTFFLPTKEAGRVSLGSEVHLVLDAAPQYVIPAKVSYVADVAQFTPKTVETEQERQKLMFRIKARIDPRLLKKHLNQIKTGLPGMAYVRLSPKTQWPPDLQVKLPQ